MWRHRRKRGATVATSHGCPARRTRRSCWSGAPRRRPACFEPYHEPAVSRRTACRYLYNTTPHLATRRCLHHLTRLARRLAHPPGSAAAFSTASPFARHGEIGRCPCPPKNAPRPSSTRLAAPSRVRLLFCCCVPGAGFLKQSVPAQRLMRAGCRFAFAPNPPCFAASGLDRCTLAPLA